MNTNTHDMFNTVSHEHIGKDLKEILIAECADGRWFIENNWGDKDFECFTGISNPHITPYVEPLFFHNEDKALEYAIKIVQSVIPEFTYPID